MTTFEFFPLAVLAAALGAYFLLRRIQLGAMAWWTAALVLFVVTATWSFVEAGSAGLLVVRGTFVTGYFALLLAGALAHTGHRVPPWMLPAAIVFGGVRGLLTDAGFSTPATFLALGIEPALPLLAAYFIVSSPIGSSSLTQRALVPSLGIIALLQGLTLLIGSVEGGAVPPALLGVWFVAEPLLFGLQILACNDQAKELLRDERDELELRVAERTRELAQSVEKLRGEVREREAAQAALHESQERYRAISELSVDFAEAFRFDSDARLEWLWTERLNELSGREEPRDSWLDIERWSELAVPEDRARVAREVREIANGTRETMEYRMLTAGGEIRHLSCRFGHREEEGNGVVRVIGVSRDVTEQVRAEEERRRFEEHLQEVQRLESLGMLAGGVAHDFNNVLTVILGNCRLGLEQAGSGSALAERLERIESSAEHASRLTNQMLTYAGKARVSFEPCNVSQLVRDTLDLLRASIHEKCRLDFELVEGLPNTQGDQTQLQQVIVNLVRNASDALGQEGGDVTIRTSYMELDAPALRDMQGSRDLEPGAFTCIEVCDSGSGIDPEQLPRVFDPFFSTKPGGRGLGLAGVLGIVRSHHGAIGVENQPGSGSRFRVLLPVSTREHDRSDAVALEAFSKGTLLVVDDDEAVREVSQAFLERAGFTALTATDGRSGIDLLRARGDEIDAVVLDLTMPEMGGEQTLMEMRRLRGDLPVILVSGYEDSAAVNRLLERGAMAILYKPYAPEELIERVGAAIAARR